MLTGNRTRRVDIPDEEGQWVELRELSGRQLRRVKKAKLSETIANAKEMGPEMMQSISEVNREEVEEAARDPLAEYDIDKLLEEGIVDWSYDAEVNTDTIGQLDKKTEEFLAMQLVGAEEEEDRKKD